ncbi:MAG: protein phosphatase 2C domain-containing protein, partial [Peptostreptococcaceae bacterium]
MVIEIFASSVTGYKNMIKNKTSQDYCEYKKVNNIVIAALADGHSTQFFEYSDVGSKLGCKVGIDVLENYISNGEFNIEKIAIDLKNEVIQRDINEKWNEMVEKHYKKHKPVVFRTEYAKYSTTLVMAMIGKDHRLYINIGDSTILVKKQEKYMKVLGNNNGYLVNSLGSKDSYKKIEYYIENIDYSNKDDYIIMCSDGYIDGFDNKKEMIKDLNETIYKYEKNVFTRLYLYKNYKKHLNN